MPGCTSLTTTSQVPLHPKTSDISFLSRKRTPPRQEKKIENPENPENDMKTSEKDRA
jgi:hypothetical protein